MLERCQASVAAQVGCGEIQHVIVEDHVGIGIAGMFAAIEWNAGILDGEWVYVLQDDDELAGPWVVRELEKFLTAEAVTTAVTTGACDVVMVKNRKRGNVYPTFWRVGPELGYVDLGSYVVRREVFVRHAGDFGKRYAGDFDFIRRLWDAGYEFGWCDVLFAQEQVCEPGLGRPESELIGAEGAKHASLGSGWMLSPLRVTDGGGL